MKNTRRFNGQTYTYNVGYRKKEDADGYMKIMRTKGYKARKTYLGRGRGWAIWIRK